MDKIIKKLRKLLEKAGLDEEKIESIVADVSNEEAPVEEDKVETAVEVEEEKPEKAVEEAPAPAIENELPNEAPVVDEAVGEATPNEENPVVEETATDVPPVAEETITPEVPPVEENPAPVGQPVDPELIGKIEEQANTIEGLVARIESLEDALRKGGVLSDEGVEIGIDESKVPANDPEDDPLTSVLDKFNRRR